MALRMCAIRSWAGKETERSNPPGSGPCGRARFTAQASSLGAYGVEKASRARSYALTVPAELAQEGNGPRRNLEEEGINLDADAFVPHSDSGSNRGPAPHERIENYAAAQGEGGIDNLAHKRLGLQGGVGANSSLFGPRRSRRNHIGERDS